MANTYTVKPGDSLWRICSNHGSLIAGNNINAKIATLRSLNGIPANSSLIHPGQVLIFSGGGGGGSVSSSSTATPSNGLPNDRVVIDILNIRADTTTGRDVYAHWAWKRYNESSKDPKTGETVWITKGYKIRWEYDTVIDGRSVTQYVDSTTDTPGDTFSTFTVPEAAQPYNNWVQVFITPISNTYEEGEGETQHTEPYIQTALVEVGKQYHFMNNPPFTPDNPTCEIEDATLTMKIESIPKKNNTASVIFQVVKDNASTIYTSPPISVVPVTDDYGTVSHPYRVPLGSNYKVRAKAVASNGKESGWTDFSKEAETKPAAPKGITSYKTDRYTEPDGTIKYKVYLEWSPVPSAVKYKVQCAIGQTIAEDSYSDVKEDVTTTSATILDVEIGNYYNYRVIAITKSDLESDPSEALTIVVGTAPGKPATWSSSDSAFEGDNMELNWTHNSTDGSVQTYAQIGLKIGDDGDWFTRESLFNSTDSMSEEEIIIGDYDYGKFISYKGNVRFKMDTNNVTLRNKKVQWRVRTAGVTRQVSDGAWSDPPSTIYIYEKPTFMMSMTKDASGETGMITELGSFPFYVNGNVVFDSPNDAIQSTVGYNVRIVSKDTYSTVDDVGNTKVVNAGDAVFERYIDTSNPLELEISANDVDLESGMEYILYCTLDMSTGLTLTGSHEFDVYWDRDISYNIVADIAFDKNTFSSRINPYAIKLIPNGPGGKNLLPYPYYNTTETINGIVFTDNGDGTITANGTATAKTLFYLQSDMPDGVYLQSGEKYFLSGTPSGGSDSTYRIEASNGKVWVSDTGNGKLITGTGDNYIFYVVVMSGAVLDNVILKPQLELGAKATDYESYYESYIDGGFVENITLSVYRREYNGTYTQIATGIPNTNTAVTDPHPALDYARYRIVAKDSVTGAVSFYDAPGYPVKCTSIIIQWNEDWHTFDITDMHSVEGPAWSGSLLELKYNVDVTDSRNREVEMIQYAGRENPVTYYGTFVTEKPSWNVVIPKEDKETIYALRRLSMWSGDVYIREPSGMGYWANVQVNFNQKHKDVTIPVTLNITKVEGGV